VARPIPSPPPVIKAILPASLGIDLSFPITMRKTVGGRRFTCEILRAAIREQVGSTVKRLHRGGTIENIGAGRASKWKQAGLAFRGRIGAG
jgi:chromosome condensin MukBEF MukE localization factor